MLHVVVLLCFPAFEVLLWRGIIGSRVTRLVPRGRYLEILILCRARHGIE